jgi:hypothetical protein
LTSSEPHEGQRPSPLSLRVVAHGVLLLGHILFLYCILQGTWRVLPQHKHRSLPLQAACHACACDVRPLWACRDSLRHLVWFAFVMAAVGVTVTLLTWGVLEEEHVWYGGFCCSAVLGLIAHQLRTCSLHDAAAVDMTVLTNPCFTRRCLQHQPACSHACSAGCLLNSKGTAKPIDTQHCLCKTHSQPQLKPIGVCR